MINRLTVGCFLFFSLFLFQVAAQVSGQATPDLLKQAIQLTHEKKHLEAIEVFKKILAVESTHTSALEGLGINYFLIKNYTESQKTLERLLNLNPKHLTALLTLGKLHEAQGVYYKANYYYEKVLKLDAYQLEAYWGKGRVFNQDRQYRNAIEIFKKGLNLDPYHKGLLQGIAFAYRRLGDYAEAIKHEKKILELYPEDLETVLRTADHYESLGDVRNAIHWYEKARRLNPRDERIHVKLAMLYSKTDRIDEAATSLRKAVELQEGNLENYIALGRVYGWLAQLDESRSAFEKALRLDPKNTMVLNDLATVKLFDGDWEGAQERFEQVLKIDPKDKTALKGLDSVRIEKSPVYTSRFRYVKERDKDPTEDRHAERQEISQEFIYKFSPSLFVEGRHQRTDRYQNLDNGDREFKFHQDIGSLRLNAKWGKHFSTVGRVELNQIDDEGTQIYNFKKKVNRLTGYLYGLGEIGQFFAFINASRSLLLRRIDPDILTMEHFESYGGSFGYNFTRNFETVLRYFYINFKGPHERHDVESVTTWRLPFYRQVELGYGFNWLSNPSSRIHSVSILLQEQIFRFLLFELFYKHDWDDNKTDQGLVRVDHGRALVSLPFYKKISLTLEAEIDTEKGKDHDVTQTYRTYLQIPLGAIF